MSKKVKKLSKEKLSKVVQLADNVAEEVATKIVTKEITPTNEPVMPSHASKHAPEGFAYVGKELAIKLEVNHFDPRVSRVTAELAPVSSIKSIFIYRYVDNILVVNPQLLEERIWLYYKGRFTFGTITNKQLTKLKEKCGNNWPCLYTYYSLASDIKTAFTFTHSNWPTPEEIAEKMDHLNEVEQTRSVY